MPNCPNCASARTVKNGRIHNGKQRFLCQECGRQFVEQPTKKVIHSVTRALIDRLLLERISLAGIARAVQVSEMWRQTYVNQKYADVPHQIEPTGYLGCVAKTDAVGAKVGSRYPFLL